MSSQVRHRIAKWHKVETIPASAADISNANALSALLSFVKQTGYSFITTTPLTHSRTWKRSEGQCGTLPSLRDIFGWSLAFDPETLPASLLESMKAADILIPAGSQYRSAVRISTLAGQLFLHSAYPTDQRDSVFFGPDTYRFCNFIKYHALPSSDARILDIGCGSGAGGIVAALCNGSKVPIVMNDINLLALRYTAINARTANAEVQLIQAGTLAPVEGTFDLIVSNPPYLDDAEARTYRHGGERLGRALSVRIVKEALPRLAPNGRLLLYTGVAIVGGVDQFLAELQPILAAPDLVWSYEEIDPDVFGEELDRDIYSHSDRIAVVGLVVSKRSELLYREWKC